MLRQSDALLKVYPPFVNFFDLSKEALQRCDKMFPRFHAFLKVGRRSDLLCLSMQCILHTIITHTPRYTHHTHLCCINCHNSNTAQDLRGYIQSYLYALLLLLSPLPSRMSPDQSVVDRLWPSCSSRQCRESHASYYC